jgi:hypothetical protein
MARRVNNMILQLIRPCPAAVCGRSFRRAEDDGDDIGSDASGM